MDTFHAIEFGKKYNHTTALILEKKSKQVFPVYFETIDPHDETPYAVIVKNEHKDTGKNHIYNKVDSNSFQIPLKQIEAMAIPHKRVFDLGGRTLVYTRIPNRQWRKGLCADNTRLIDPVLQIVTNLPRQETFKLGGFENRTVFKVLFALFNQEYANTLPNALAQIAEHGLVSRSINETYWVCCFMEGKTEFILFRYDIPIAFYDSKQNKFTPLVETYRQEVLDFAKRHTNFSTVGECHE